MNGNAKTTASDRALAWILGTAVAVLAWLTGNHLELPPELWEKLSVAAGIRPPVDEFPILWQICLSSAVEHFGISGAIAALKFLGPVSLGVLTAVTYRLFCGYLPAVVRNAADHSKWTRRLARVLAAEGTVFFVCSEPVWLAGRVLSPEMTSLLCTALVLLLILNAVGKSSGTLLISSGALAGVLASETPAAFLIPVLTIGFLNRRQQPDTGIDRRPFPNPVAYIVSVRRTLYAFAATLLATAAINLAFYRECGGGGADDPDTFISIVGYALNYPALAAKAMSPLGWLFAFAAVIAPMIVTVFKKRELTDTTRFLDLSYALLALLTGTMAYMQSTGFSGFHFWKWKDGCVDSPYLLCMCLFATSLTAMYTLSMIAVELYLRNYTRLYRETFPYEAESDDVSGSTVKSTRKILKKLHVLALFSPAVLVGAVVFFRFDTTTRRMCAIVNDIAYATARECGNATMLFTDGSYDAAVETASAESGHAVKAVSLMSGNSDYDIALRLRGETNAENIALLKTSAADAMRTWVHGKYACASNIAVQIGLELWRERDAVHPKTGGFVARTSGFSDEDAAAGTAAAHAVIERMLKLREELGSAPAGYPSLNRLLDFGQWRLARMCRRRADSADRATDQATSEKELSLADHLDALNPEWNALQENTKRFGELSSVHLTPREGLKLGLARADFRIAGNYAKKILDTAPDDMFANFAAGMMYFTEKRYGKAEIHLKKSLAANPDEPAVLNNLAVVQLRLGKLDEAETNAVKALRLLPKSKEIKTTLRHIRQAGKESE